MAAKQEVTIEEAEGVVTVSTWARAPSAGVALHNLIQLELKYAK